jgi:peptide/nickel transport system permease protein
VANVVVPTGGPLGGGLMAGPGAVLAAETAGAVAAGSGRVRRGLGPVFWVCAAWVTLMILLAVLAPLLPLTNPLHQNYSAVNAGPSIHHLLGTDDLGRDLLSRMLFGSRASLVIGFVPVLIGLVVGGTAGLLAGYRGGPLDAAFNIGSFVVIAFPALLAIMVVENFWPPTTLVKLVLYFAVAGSPLLFRVIRATTLSYANREFITAARAMGARTGRILLRELLPNVMPTAIAFALIGVATAVVLEGSLAFLGLSIAIPSPSLGNIINEGVNNNLLQTNPYIALWPALYIFLLLTSLNLMADRLRSAFDVRDVKL